jgi:hypothetical protein
VPRALEAAVTIARADALSRSLRFVYVGDGAPSIGALTPASLETDVRSVLEKAGNSADPSTLTAVAVGVDADLASLEAMARGGGGVVVPYVAGEKVGATALGVLEVAYGATLRDATLSLPEGLTEVAPSKLGAVRAGDTVSIVARMNGAQVKGTATLSGTLAGKPWSRSFPIDVQRSEDPALAWVPRTFAAKTIADLDRSGDDAKTKTEEIALSKAFAVPSRFTSLVVMESPAMAAAFGVERKVVVPTWLGDGAAQAGATTNADAQKPQAPNPKVFVPGTTSMMAVGTGKSSGTSDGATGDTPTDGRPCKWREPAPVPVTPTGSLVLSSRRHHWYCAPTFSTDGRQPAALEGMIDAARAAVKAAPDARAPLATLFALQAHRDDDADATITLLKWTGRDPFDADAILRKSDVVARDADRARALRIALGALDATPEDGALADGLADVAILAGDPRLACDLRAVHATFAPGDAGAAARRAACLAELSGDGAKPMAKTDAKPGAKLGGLTVDATWTGATDIDVALVDPKGARLSWLSPSGVMAQDATAMGHERVGLTSPISGTYLVEIARARKDDTTPVKGTLVVSVAGFPEQRYAFSLDGPRATVAYVDLGWKDQWIDTWVPRRTIEYLDDF